MVGTRDTPRDLQDSPDYTNPLAFSQKKRKEMSSPGISRDHDSFKTLARECYDSSTNWLNAGRRIAWNDSLRAFQGLHYSGSKYLSTDYRYRSRLFRPKTRTMVRKAEAQCAAAFFGNEDCISIGAQDDDNPLQKASAEVLKSLLQYRLTKTIPWFLTVVGARQDAEVMGICVGKAYWKFQEKYKNTDTKPRLDDQGQPVMDENGEPIEDYFDTYETATDHPWIDLISPENIRFDPGADYRNPIATSPYIIELIPMYISDVKLKIDSGEWLPVSESALRASSDLDDDVTRRSREQGRVPGKDHDSWKPKDYDICWVRENILRIDGEDVHGFTLGSAGEMLSEPRPLEEVYLQGTRPYVVGTVMPETHKTYPSSKVELVRDLQQQANDVVNLRLDNVKLALNPRQFLREGKGVDPADVRSFQPGKVVMLKDPEADIKWDRPPEVTASSYQEQDRINLDFDDLAGGMTQGTTQSSDTAYKSVGNMTMMQGEASQIGEYEQRVFAETFVEPILMQLVKLEQAYETDPVVLAIAGRQANLFQKFGISHITDELLQQDLTTKVNVGLGATNPKMKLQNFLTATQAIGQMFGPTAAMAANPEEVISEVFGLCGYKDGDRFFMPGSDIHSMMIQHAQMQAAGKGGHAGNDPSRLQVAQISAQSKLQDTQIHSQTDLQLAKMDFMTEMMKEHAETQRGHLQGQRDMMNSQQDRQFQHAQGQQQMQHQVQQQVQQPQKSAAKPEQSSGAAIHYDEHGKRIA